MPPGLTPFKHWRGIKELNRYFKAALALLAIALAGCSALTRTPYKAPAVPLPATFAHATTHAATTHHDAWWRSFNEPNLDAWVDMALARNADLAAAAIRVKRATLEARLAHNAFFPSVNSSIATGTNRPLSGDKRRTKKTSNASLGLSWEIDLFDRLGAQYDAASFEAQASAEDRNAVALTLVSSTVNLYWQLAFANERIEVAEQSLSHAQRAQNLVASQYAAGAVSGLERRETEQTVAEQQAALSQLVQARTELRQALMILLDGAPAPRPEPTRLATLALPTVPAGLPAQLLGRRPDLRAAELRLRGTLANSDAAQARYYPSITLTGGLGTSSRELLNLLANPVATLGVGLNLPFLNVREMRLNTAIARSRYEEAVVLFRKSLYTALGEVEQTLSARTQLAQQAEARLRARTDAAEIERLYEIRYRAGQVPLRAWLDAQERRRAADIALAAIHLTQLQNYVTLNQALGGSPHIQ